MGCGCNKGGMRNTVPRAGRARGVTGPISGPQTGAASAPTPSQIQALMASQTNATPTASRSPAGLSNERRLIEKKRRDAIQNALGKG